MRNLRDLSFTSPNGIVENNNGTQSLIAKRPPIGEKFSPPYSMFKFQMENIGELEEYVVIEYNCFGINRTPNRFKGPFITLKKGEEDIPLFRFDDLTIDKNTHSIIVKAPEGSFTSLDLSFYCDKVLEAYLTITKLYTCKKSELPVSCEKGMDVPAKDMTPIDISDKFDLEYIFDDFDSHNDSGLFFDKENVALYGIPFNVKTSGKNLVAAPPAPAENEDIIDNFGQMCKRRICQAISRDGETVIDINKKASEIYFILTLSGKRWLRVKYGSDPTILGSATCDISEPLKIVDTEYFMAEVVYKDGRRDTHLPLNLCSGRHGVAGDISVYGVPCFGEVEKLIIHNRYLDGDVNLAAVTVNETDERLYPEMLIPEKAEKIVRVIDNAQKVTLKDNILSLRNGALYMSLDISKGLRLLEMTNAFAPDMKAKKDTILKTRTSDGIVDDVFELVSASVIGNTAYITYKYESTIFAVSAFLEGKDNVKWNLSITNNGNEEFRKGIIFPEILVDYGSFAENWYFLPAYQNIDSNETFYMYEESAPSFPMQFMDTYSPSMQGGVCIATEERELVTRKYSLSKDDNGIDFYVEYPIIYGDIASGASFTASPCVITCHDGNWKSAYNLYKTWVDSWYAPYKCQDKQWYRECFWLLADITDFFETTDMINDDMRKHTAWYTEETKTFNYRKILEYQKAITGVYPDILHMWKWNFMLRKKADGSFRSGNCWGNYNDEDYDKFGGKEALRNALHDIRDNMGIQVSLYMHPTLLSNCYPHHEKFFESSMVKHESGGRIGLAGDSFRMCHAEESWRDFSANMYPRVYKDLGIPLLYVDEFSLRIGNRCYAEGHGHHCPSNLLKTDRDYIAKLKETVPEEVVLYGEYVAADVNARYIDCNISYYILDSIIDMIETMKRANDGDDRLSRVFLHTYRFAFPKIVQLILPMAMRNISWHPQKFLFFNAEAIYDSFWDCEESRGQDFTVHAFKLKKKYADCYTSDYPETMIETESPAICMNKFPSKTSDRVLYNVYNRAYSTFRGVALKVPHKEGATYYDAWNEKELKYNVVDGMAELYLEIGAQEMGCIVIE